MKQDIYALSIRKIGRGLRSLTLAIVLGTLYTSSVSVLAQTAESSQTKGLSTLSGHVIDAESRETLIGATVFAPEVQQGTYTNSYGFFSLTTKTPVRTLRISYIGYETQTITLSEDEKAPLRIALRPEGQLQEVVVTEERKHLHAPQPGAVSVPVHIIKQTPALLGENDLMKALQYLPGVQGGSEGSAGVHVRGGGADENLILLDGVSLYNVDHLLGFFSVFTPEAVKKVDLYKGNFPARFGGRLSSVIDVRTNDGNMQRYKGVASIGLLSSKLQFEGPIIKDRTSFNISARRTYADMLVRPFLENDTDGGYYFYDLNAKLQHRITDRDRLFLSLYHGLDKASGQEKRSYTNRNSEDEPERIHVEDAAGLHWGNTLAALRWNHIFSPKVYSDLTLAYTHYHFSIFNENIRRTSGKESAFNSLQYNSGIQDLGVNWNAHYFATPKLEMRFGADYIHHSFRPESYGVTIRGEQGVDQEAIQGLFGKKRPYIPAHHAALYAEAKAQLPYNLEINAGLRAALFAVDGKAYPSLQPRLTLDWRATPTLSTTLGYSRMAQNVHLLTTAYVALPLDLWVPATKNIPPMTSDQLSLTANYRFGGWSMTLEGYYKQMNNVLEYRDGTAFIGSSEGWEEKVEVGLGRSYGMELTLMRQVGRTTGWLSYNLAKTERRFPDGSINQGKWFPYKYDRRHKLNIVLSHKLSRRIDLSASWEFFTGGTMTLPYERVDYLHVDEKHKNRYGFYADETSADYVPERNNYRINPTHRLNVSFNFNRFHKSGARSIWNVSFYNLYNARNPAFVLPGDFTDRGDSNRTDRVTQVTILPFIPSFSYTYKF